MTVVVVGSLNLDTVLDVAHLPGPGDTVVAEGPGLRACGGKGANQAAAAATYLGSAGTVAMVGCVGDDDAGPEMTEDLRRRGVDVDRVRRVDGPSGTALVATDPHGENLIIVDPGANARLTAADVQIPLVARADLLLVQLEVPLAAVRAAVEHTAGRVVLNPAPARVDAASLDGIDVLVPNRLELARLTGAPAAAKLDDVINQARRLAAEADVVVTLGREGAVVVTRRGTAEVVEAPRVEAVDSTGAGDCFCGVLAVCLHEGADLVDATRVAVAAASLSVGAPGARRGLPHRSDVVR